MMSISVPDPKRAGWHHSANDAPVRLALSNEAHVATNWAGATAAGFPIELSLVPLDSPLDQSYLAGAAAAVIEVTESSQASVDRFARLATGEVPLIAASFDPSLAFVRSLIRMGAHDVVPMPVELSELETALDPIRRQRASQATQRHAGNAKLVSVIKSVGGAGATALVTQLATRFAASESSHGREACLIDLDVQFGNAAFYLGLRPKLSLIDLIEAGSRIDGALLRSTTTLHPSGLAVVASPPEMIPLESLSSDQMIEIAEVAMREFGTVFVDLPSNWTNWSLSLLARSDIVLLVTELSVAGLQRARRQLDLIAAQELGEIDVRIVVNRFEKGMFKTLRPAMVRESLGRDIGFTVANDFAVMSAAIDRGVPIDEVRRRTALGKDLATLDSGLAVALGLER